MATEARPLPRRDLLDRAPLLVLAVLVGLRVLTIGLLAADIIRHDVQDPDAQRAVRIVTSPATPYRDFPVEYMPLETLMLHGVVGDTIEQTVVRYAVLAFVADMAAAWGLAWGWRRRDALVYLLAGSPLLAFSYQRFDYVPIAFAVWAVAMLVRRGDDPRAGVAFGLAIFAKLWPIVMLPMLLLARARRAIVAAVATLAVGGFAWVAISGPKAPFQVISFRGATGWAIESTVGNLVWIVTRGQIYPQAGAARIGNAPSWAKGVLLVLLALSLLLIWRRAWREDRGLAGSTSLAAVLALLVCSPLFSTQYVAWLTPWAALSLAEEERDARRLAVLAITAVAITGMIHASYLTRSPLTNIAEKYGLLVRNALCVVALGGWLVTCVRQELDLRRATVAAA
jgi:hypothetical protein